MVAPRGSCWARDPDQQASRLQQNPRQMGPPNPRRVRAVGLLTRLQSVPCSDLRADELKELGYGANGASGRRADCAIH